MTTYALSSNQQSLPEQYLGLDWTTVGTILVAGGTAQALDTMLLKLPLVPQIDDQLSKLPIIGGASRHILLTVLGIGLQRVLGSSPLAVTFGQALTYISLAEIGSHVLGPVYSGATPAPIQVAEPVPAPAQ